MEVVALTVVLFVALSVAVYLQHRDNQDRFRRLNIDIRDILVEIHNLQTELVKMESRVVLDEGHVETVATKVVAIEATVGQCVTHLNGLYRQLKRRGITLPREETVG